MLQGVARIHPVSSEVKHRRGFVRRIGEVDAQDFARPVRVLFRRMTRGHGGWEMELRPLSSRRPVRVPLETLVRAVLGIGRPACEDLGARVETAAVGVPAVHPEFLVVAEGLAPVESAFGAGKEAWLAGFEERDCPFAVGHELRSAWLRGFRSGRVSGLAGVERKA
jgi:ribosome modulation factor